MSLKAIFFDLDDTLCDYEASVERSFEAAFAMAQPKYPHLVYGDTRLTFEEVLERQQAAVGRSFLPGNFTKDRFIATLAAGGINDEPLSTEMALLYRRARMEHLALFEDAVPTLQALHGGYILGLVTNGPSDIQRQEIATLNIGSYFPHIVVSEEVGHDKPHPAVFQRALSLAGCDPEDALFVGNSLAHDVAGAKGVGMRAAWVNRKAASRRDGLPAPDYELSSLREVVTLVGSRSDKP